MIYIQSQTRDLMVAGNPFADIDDFFLVNYVWPRDYLQRIQDRIDELRQQIPRRKGERWGPEEDTELLQRFVAGLPIEEIARLHERSLGSIRSRWQKLHDDGRIGYVLND